MRQFGVSETAIGETMQVLRETAAAAEAPFRVWPENALALAAFRACSSQWRTVSVGMAGIRVLGLDYASAKVMIDGLGLQLKADDWHGFRVLERTAAAIANGEDIEEPDDDRVEVTA